MSEARPTGVHLKRLAKLLTVIGITTKHAIRRINFISDSFVTNDYFPKLIRKIISTKTICLNLYTKSL